MAALVQVDEQGKTVARWALGETAVVAGRGADCAVQLLDQRASRQHFTVTPRGGNHVLTDLGSANGTFLNENRVRGELPLADGDRIRVGQTTLVFEQAHTKGLKTVIAELEQQSQKSGKGYRTMIREISKSAKG